MIRLSSNFDIKEAYYTNLKEEKTEEIKVENNTISVKELSHCKFCDNMGKINEICSSDRYRRYEYKSGLD